MHHLTIPRNYPRSLLLKRAQCKYQENSISGKKGEEGDDWSAVEQAFSTIRWVLQYYPQTSH